MIYFVEVAENLHAQPVESSVLCLGSINNMQNSRYIKMCTRLGNPKVMILGVNPFEDLPGFQLLGLLRAQSGLSLVAADDSEHALQILHHAGYCVEQIPHPKNGIDSYLNAIQLMCQQSGVDLLIPATDAHLMALASHFAESPFLQVACPQLKFLSDQHLFTKGAIQDWLSPVTQTPQRWQYNNDADLIAWERNHEYPVMVKGVRKGGIKCDDHSAAAVARRILLKNPSNHSAHNGVFLETVVDGEEHTMLLVLDGQQRTRARVCLRKLATTEMGTTLAAEVEEIPAGLSGLAEWAASTILGPAVFEAESRVDAKGRFWVFEANLRFPSWIGALGDFGSVAVENFINSLVSSPRHLDREPIPIPNGTIIYRLPQSGVLPLTESFTTHSMPKADREVLQTVNVMPKRELLWEGAPHRFLVK